MTYSEFVNELQTYADEPFATFQRKLIFTERKILGVRTPILRKLAKRMQKDLSTLLSYPDEYYEVVFIQLTAVSTLPYEEFLQYLEFCVRRMDNWALCDTFKAKCIQKNRPTFLPRLESLFQEGKEYFVRYVLVTLLSFYVEEEYLAVIEEYLRRTNTEPYYVRMAAAWLTAEVLVKYYEFGVGLLQSKILDVNTHNKAIQKGIESYRLNDKQKEYLRSLKIKNR